MPGRFPSASGSIEALSRRPPDFTPTRSSTTNPYSATGQSVCAYRADRILSSDQVVQAAERAGRVIIETYLSPNREFGDLPGFMEEMDPFVASGKPADANCIRSHLAEGPSDARADTSGQIVVHSSADRRSGDAIAPRNRFQEDYRRRYRSWSVDVSRQPLPLLRFKAGDRRGGRGGFVRTLFAAATLAALLAAPLWSV